MRGFWIGLILVVAIVGGARAARPSQLAIKSFVGQDLFEFYCANCHGRAGTGHGPVAATLKTKPADLTLIAVRNGGAFPRERIEKFIADGDRRTRAHGTPDMPIWGEIFRGLDPSDKRAALRIENLARYIESIQAKEPSER